MSSAPVFPYFSDEPVNVFVRQAGVEKGELEHDSTVHHGLTYDNPFIKKPSSDSLVHIITAPERENNGTQCRPYRADEIFITADP